MVLKLDKHVRDSLCARRRTGVVYDSCCLKKVDAAHVIAQRLLSLKLSLSDQCVRLILLLFLSWPVAVEANEPPLLLPAVRSRRRRSVLGAVGGARSRWLSYTA